MLPSWHLRHAIRVTSGAPSCLRFQTWAAPWHLRSVLKCAVHPGFPEGGLQVLSERVGGTVSVGVRFMARGRSVPVYTQCVCWVCTREQCECWVGNRSCRGWRLTTLAAPLDSGGGGVLLSEIAEQKPLNSRVPGPEFYREGTSVWKENLQKPAFGRPHFSCKKP